MRMTGLGTHNVGFLKGKESINVDDTGTGIDDDRVFLRAMMRGDVVLYLITFSIMQVWCGVYVSSERTRKGRRRGYL